MFKTVQKIVYSKARVTHVLVTLPNLLKELVHENKKRLLWRNLNSYTTCLWGTESHTVWIQCTTIYFFFLYLECHVSHVTLPKRKEGLYLFQNNEKIGKIFSISTVGRFVECAIRLYLIGFQTSLGRHQQTHTEDKPYECWTVYLLLFVLVHFLVVGIALQENIKMQKEFKVI